ncbi:MAG: DUF4442 domain-containing protein [Bacteroidetes bacterium]|nr:DUF4442 domain-containing protein [Bacteroidota bacterium]
MDLKPYLEKARYSKFNRWLLNTLLLRVVPFNKPHRIQVVAIGDDSVTVKAKNYRNNRNHVGGVHACLLATLCEYASGLELLRNLSPNQYRLLMRSLDISYHKQARKAAVVTFQLDKEILQKHIIAPLEEEESIFREFKVEAFNEEQELLCTARINWQIKSWKAVKGAKT